MSKNTQNTAVSSRAKKKPGRKNRTGIAFPNSNRAYRSLSHQEKTKFLTYQKEYVKEHYRTYLIRMNIEDDADIIAWLEMQANKSEYIRYCIDMERKRETKRNPQRKKF